MSQPPLAPDDASDTYGAVALREAVEAAYDDGGDPHQLALPIDIESRRPRERASPVPGMPGPRERSLLYELTKHIRGPSKDPPGPPPSAGWLIWVVLDLAAVALRYPRTLQASGGEARRSIRVRRTIVSVGGTCLIGVAMVLCLYRMTQMIWNIDTVLAAAGDRAVSGLQWVRGSWDDLTMVAKTVLGAVVAVTACVSSLLRLRRRRVRRPAAMEWQP